MTQLTWPSQLLDDYFDPADSQRPYANGTAQLQDWLRLFDLLCAAAFHIRHQAGDATSYALRGVVIGEEQVQLALTASLRTSPPAARGIFPGILDQLDQRAALTTAAGIALPLEELSARFALSAFETFSLMLAAAPDLDRKFERIFGFLQDDVTVHYPTLGLARDLYELIQPLPEKEAYALLDRENLFPYLFLAPAPPDPAVSRLALPLSVNQRLLFYLLEEPCLFPALVPYCTLADAVAPPAIAPPVLVNQEQAELVYQITKDALADADLDGFMIHLCGPDGAGKYFAIQAAAQRSGLALLSLDCQLLLQESREEMGRLLHLVVVQCILDRRVLVLQDLQADAANQLAVLLLLKYLRGRLAFFYCTSRDSWTSDLGPHIRRITVEYDLPSAIGRQALWSYFLDRENCCLEQAVDLPQLAGRYDLTAGQIRQVIQTARLSGLAKEANRLTWPQISLAVREICKTRLGELATRIVANFSWDDLQLDQEPKALLARACDHLRFRHVVQEAWGFNQKLPYGKGLSMLLYGPPGTGKTMAAQVIANTLGLDIFRIDLSQIVSKYIGETEKNLRELFTAAKNANAILFFDEADALFAKRTEISDAKDKYANVETSYLLQRIEQYNGFAILATNNAQNLDEAFKRRISYFIHLPMPGQEVRLAIWQRVFPAAVPLDHTVDLAFLAERFELSGSAIKSIAVNACYIAAAQGIQVSKGHIMEALRMDYQKSGRVLLGHELM